MNEILIVFLCFDVYLLLITRKLSLICDCKLLQILLFFLRLKVMSKIVSAGFNVKTKAWTFEAKDKAIRPEAKAIKVGLEAPQSLTSTSTSLSLNQRSRQILEKFCKLACTELNRLTLTTGLK